MTRTQNSFFNYITSLASTLLVVALSFITRSVFTRVLGGSYLGIEGLFSNILSMLSLANLGFGTAIVYKLYKPIEDDDRPRILVLLKLYRTAYLIIGAVIVVLGICLIPFLPTLVRDYDTLSALGLNGVGIFLLYLFNTAASYWVFAYKVAFVQANQKTYLLTIVGYAVSIANSLCQILALVLFRSFIAYLIVFIVFGILQNLVYAYVCDKRYPFVNEKTDDHISRAELKDFFKDCSAMFLYSACSVIIGGSDNIVLSALLGINAVGLYFGYVTIRSSVRSLLYTFLTSIQASLGSLYTTGNLDWTRTGFRVVNFAAVWLYSIGAIGTAVLADEFIPLWLGDTSYVITSWVYDGTVIRTPVALLVGIEIYIIGKQNYCGIFRNAMGLFQQMKYRPIASIIINLALSIILVPYIGIAGCVVSTIIAGLTTNLIFDPIIIHKTALKTSVVPYFLRNLLYDAVAVAAGLLCWWACSLIPTPGALGFVIRGCICVGLTCIVFAGCFFRTTEFRFLLNSVKDLLPRRA